MITSHYMTVFFTSDTHFGHAGRDNWLINQRGFASVDEMDETLIANWNAAVSQRDEVWFLGDFTLKGAQHARRYLDRLNGKLHLIWGNHDVNAVRNLPRWTSSQFGAEIRLDGYRLTLLHYAMKIWNRSHHGSLMLYGHSHGSLLGDSQSCDVGVDVWQFRPTTLDQILGRLATQPERTSVDHHRPLAVEGKPPPRAGG
jgi:calcineurin-like phosphoesterase family protein